MDSGTEAFACLEKDIAHKGRSLTYMQNLRNVPTRLRLLARRGAYAFARRADFFHAAQSKSGLLRGDVLL